MGLHCYQPTSSEFIDLTDFYRLNKTKDMMSSGIPLCWCLGWNAQEFCVYLYMYCLMDILTIMWLVLDMLFIKPSILCNPFSQVKVLPLLQNTYNFLMDFFNWFSTLFNDCSFQSSGKFSFTYILSLYTTNFFEKQSFKNKQIPLAKTCFPCSLSARLYYLYYRFVIMDNIE